MGRAIVEYREALRLDPSSGKAHYALGLSLGANGDLDNAGTNTPRLSLCRPDLEEVRSNLRNVLREDPDPEGNRSRACQGSASCHTVCSAHNNLGIALSQKGEIIQAIAEFHEALRLNPTLGAAHNDLGIMFYKQRDLDGAVAEYRETIRLLPDYAEAYNNLGNALREKGNLDEAIAEYRKAAGHKVRLQRSAQ